MKTIMDGLVDIKAVSLNLEKPFIWASGILSPIYCDNRKTLGHPRLRKAIASKLSQLIVENYPEVEVIGGTATAGIPHATSVADSLNLPLVYFRSHAKDHGKQSQIEGDYQPGSSLVIIEDLISTGGSVLKCVETAREAGFNVLGVVCIFNYELQSAIENFDQAAIPFHSVIQFDDLYEHLNLSENEREFVDRWRMDPTDVTLWKSL